jgi:integrase
MRQEKGTKLRNYAGVYRLSDGTYRVVAKAIDPKTGKPKFKERFTREVDPQMTQNAAVAFRSQLINEIKMGTTGSDVPTEIPRLQTLCRSSWITFVTENVSSESRAAKLGRVVETHVLRRWGDHYIDRITVPGIDAWVRSLTAEYEPETIRHHVGLFRRILGKARGQYQLPPIDWDLITLPAVDNEHAMQNRLNAEQIAIVLPLIVERYPFYAPMIFTLFTLGLRYCHVAAMRWEKLASDGVIAIEETYDVSANVFSPVDQRKKAPPVIALEPRTLELVRWHRRYLMRRNHPGLKTGLLFPSEAGTRPVGNDQLNDVWREVQVLAGIDRPVTVHGIRHSFHDLARQQGVPDAVVKAMAGRAGAEVAQRGQDKHLHYSRGVTVEEMRQASMALMQLVPTAEPIAALKSRDLGRDESGRDRDSDEEHVAATRT